MMKESTILSQGHAKQLQMRNKHSMLQLGKVQLLGEEMMRLGVDICGLSEVRWDGQRAFHDTRWPYNSILRTTYSGHVRSGDLDS